MLIDSEGIMISDTISVVKQEQTEIPEELSEILVSTSDTLSGAVRFKGTRVPVQALLDTILCGESLEYFVEDFPDVTLSQARAVLRWEQNKVRESLGLDLAS